MKVTATVITPDELFYECPTCKSSYKKDGKARKNAKPVVHIHGSCGDISNREEHRVSHCKKGAVNVIIRVTGGTRRIGWKKPLAEEIQEEHESSSSDDESSVMDEDSLGVIHLE